MRPIGGALFGVFGDRIGRKKIFIITVFLIAIPTVFIGLLPTYKEIGIVAPLLLLFFRLVQGISAGGEFVASSTYAFESTATKNRCLVTAAVWSSAVLGVLIGSLLITVLSATLNHAALIHWGWRLPFLLSAVTGLIGYWLRKNMIESSEFLQLKIKNQLTKNPLLCMFKKHKAASLFIVLIIMLATTYLYLTFLFMPTFANKMLGLSLQSVFISNTLSMFFLIIFTISMGYLADRYPKFNRFMLFSIFMMLVTTIPLYALIIHHAVLGLFFAQIAFALVLAIYQGPMMAKLLSLAPTSIRFTMVGISYNVSISLFGGTAPLVATYLIHHTENLYSPSIYLTVIAAVVFLGFVGNIYLKRTVKSPVISSVHS